MFEPHSFQPSYQIALGLVHPEDRRDSDLHFQGAIRERKTFSFEQRILSNDGSERTLHQRGEVVLSHEGYAVRVIGTAQDVTERREAEQELRKANEELLTASRCAGMAEVATGVLHNVGNVLNSVNVSAMLLSDRLKRSKVGHLANASQLMKENATNLAEFFTCDPKGKMLPHFIHNVVVRVGVEQAELRVRGKSKASPGTLGTLRTSSPFSKTTPKFRGLWKRCRRKLSSKTPSR